MCSAECFNIPRFVQQSAVIVSGLTPLPVLRDVYTWESTHQNRFVCAGRGGSKWTKIYSSKRFNHYRIFCAMLSHAAASSPVPNQTLFVKRRGEGRNYCNCSTDYLYPGYGSQPLIRSHDLNIIYTQCVVPAPRRRRLLVIVFIFYISIFCYKINK